MSDDAFVDFYDPTSHFMFPECPWYIECASCANPCFLADEISQLRYLGGGSLNSKSVTCPFCGATLTGSGAVKPLWMARHHRWRNPPEGVAADLLLALVLELAETDCSGIIQRLDTDAVDCMIDGYRLQVTNDILQHGSFEKLSTHIAASIKESKSVSKLGPALTKNEHVPASSDGALKPLPPGKHLSFEDFS